LTSVSFKVIHRKSTKMQVIRTRISSLDDLFFALCAFIRDYLQGKDDHEIRWPWRSVSWSSAWECTKMHITQAWGVRYPGTFFNLFILTTAAVNLRHLMPQIVLFMVTFCGFYIDSRQFLVALSSAQVIMDSCWLYNIG
jgi:hypothetical protein